MRLNNAAKTKRDLVEEGMSRAMTIQVRLKQVRLRSQQAMARYGLEDLLDPAVRMICQVAVDVEDLQHLLQQLWQDGQERKWE